MANKIYACEEWKSLRPYIKADLLPVAESLKPGTEIRFKDDEQKVLSQTDLLNKWLEKSGLAYRHHELCTYACRDESLLDQLWEGKIGIDDFLGYPKCCVKNHRERGKKLIQYLNDEIDLSELPLPPGMIVGREMAEAVAKGRFNPAISYVLHVPCSVYCKESIELGEKIRGCFDENDFETGEYLKKSNEDNWLRFGTVWTEETWHKFAKERKKEKNATKR